MLVPAPPCPSWGHTAWRHPWLSQRNADPALSDAAAIPTSPQAMTERAQLVWEALEPLLETDPQAEQFQPFAFV